MVETERVALEPYEPSNFGKSTIQSREIDSQDDNDAMFVWSSIGRLVTIAEAICCEGHYVYQVQTRHEHEFVTCSACRKMHRV